ncbi:MAG: stage II sporulation protein P [Clostridia bacterium]|nr:stage II sporulation protein P [Clostridia bacterium]
MVHGKGRIAERLLAVWLAVVAMIAAGAWRQYGGGSDGEAATVFSVVETAPQAASDTTFRVEVIRAEVTPQMPAKRILIYHSHTWEAYTQVKDAPYVPTETWRTRDDTANMVAVGRALAASLTAMGYTVVHDETAFEPPDLANAYQRSLAMLEKRLAQGEQYDLYIDLHRDAFADANAIRRTVQIGGEDVARFMVLIGKGTGVTGSGYDVKPDWEANLAIAQRITEALNAQCEQLCRDVKIKTGRFNQHIAPCCVLIECGSNHNTLEEVLRGIPYLAQGIHQALQ